MPTTTIVYSYLNLDAENKKGCHQDNLFAFFTVKPLELE